MQVVSSRWAPSLAASHRIEVRVQVWRGGKLLATVKPLSGGVTDDWVTGIRRDLTATFDPSLESLITNGATLIPFRGINYGHGAPEILPLGVFPVTSHNVGILPDRTVQVSCHDGWQWVTGSTFLRPTSSNTAITVPTQMSRLITDTGMWPSVDVQSTSVVSTPSQVWDTDRSQAIADLGTLIGAEAYINRAGSPVVRQRKARTAPVLTIAGSRLIDLSATESTENVYNVVVASTTSADPSVQFPPVIVRITDPTHPAFPAPGRVIARPYQLTGAFRSAAEARTAALAKLDKLSAPARRVTITCIPDASLDASDTISFVWPSGAVETAQIQSITHPLTVSDDQVITTVATGGGEST